MYAEPTPEPSRGRYLFTLSLAALGVVYGDIGTSPLYAIRGCFYGEYGVPVSPANVLGVLSLIFWSLILVVSVKYLVFVMRVDNRGEGGILALMALVVPSRAPAEGRPWHLAVLGLFGAALIYGDGMITPAISARRTGGGDGGAGLAVSAGGVIAGEAGVATDAQQKHATYDRAYAAHLVSSARSPTLGQQRGLVEHRAKRVCRVAEAVGQRVAPG